MAATRNPDFDSPFYQSADKFFPANSQIGDKLKSDQADQAFQLSMGAGLESFNATQRALDESYVQARSGWRPTLSAQASVGWDEIATPRAIANPLFRNRSVLITISLILWNIPVGYRAGIAGLQQIDRSTDELEVPVRTVAAQVTGFVQPSL